MFVIKVSGSWGSCYVDPYNEPVFDIEKAEKFLTRQDAADNIAVHCREWKEIRKGHETMTVSQM